MSTQDLAAKLANYCRHGKFEIAQKELFADDAISIEPEETPDFPKETKGRDAIIDKGHKFQSMVEKVYGIKVSEPIVVGNAIAFSLVMDISMKGRPRENWSELCVYVVGEGKILSEQFFV